MTRDPDDRPGSQGRQDRQAQPRRRVVDRPATQAEPPAETAAPQVPRKREPDPMIESVPSKMSTQARTPSESPSAARPKVAPMPLATPEPVPSSAPAVPAGPVPPQPQPPAVQPTPARAVQHTQSLRELLARVDAAWVQFRAAAGAFPSERLDERLSDGGWTRKQMLAHIAAWHDLAHDRLGKLITTGKSTPLTESEEAINARVARQATGRSGGEVLKEMEMTFNRLRRQLARLTDEQLEVDDGWATFVIAANTYEHYDEHRADVHMSGPPEGRAGRR